MLYNIVQAVVLLSFLLMILLEIFTFYLLVQMDAPKRDKPVQKPRKIRLKRAEKRKKTEEMKRFETLLNNIDAYDGTDYGQKDVE